MLVFFVLGFRLNGRSCLALVQLIGDQPRTERLFVFGGQCSEPALTSSVWQALCYLCHLHEDHNTVLALLIDSDMSTGWKRSSARVVPSTSHCAGKVMATSQREVHIVFDCNEVFSIAGADWVNVGNVAPTATAPAGNPASEGIATLQMPGQDKLAYKRDKGNQRRAPVRAAAQAAPLSEAAAERRSDATAVETEAEGTATHAAAAPFPLWPKPPVCRWLKLPLVSWLEKNWPALT